jgi:hypothetical protein
MVHPHRAPASRWRRGGDNGAPALCGGGRDWSMEQTKRTHDAGQKATDGGADARPKQLRLELGQRPTCLSVASRQVIVGRVIWADRVLPNVAGQGVDQNSDGLTGTAELRTGGQPGLTDAGHVDGLGWRRGPSRRGQTWEAPGRWTQVWQRVEPRRPFACAHVPTSGDVKIRAPVISLTLFTPAKFTNDAAYLQSRRLRQS